MTPDEATTMLRDALGSDLTSREQTAANRLVLTVPSPALPEATRQLYDELRARLQTATAIDGPEHMELLYHWALDRDGFLVTLRTHTDRTRPEVDSLAGICPAAEWIEREMHELLGISFRGHPDLRHLLLDDDTWPEGRYPLRRDEHKE